MFAVSAVRIDPEDPLHGLELGERPDPKVPDGWTTVSVRATALITLGRAAGYRIWVTSRSEDKRRLALDLGADQAFETGARLPERVDVVMETVGHDTWSHSVKSLKPGGRIVISGATSGHMPPAELQRVFFLQLSVVGSTMGTRAELNRLLEFCEQSGARPQIGMRLPLREAREGFAAMALGEQFGKIVFTVD